MPCEGPASTETHDAVTDDAFTDEHVTAAVRERWSRQRFLHLLLVAGLVLGAPTLALTLVDALDEATAFPTARLAGSLAFLIPVAVLIVVNRRGHTLLASWAICGILVLNGSWLFPLPELNTVLAMYATPILVGAFLIKPPAAVYLYALSCADYLVACLHEGRPYMFNWLSLVVLGGVAVVACLASRRSAWFEESEAMYRSELDRVAAELDLLKQRLAASPGQPEAPFVAASRAPSSWALRVEVAGSQGAEGVSFARVPERDGEG